MDSPLVILCCKVFSWENAMVEAPEKTSANRNIF
jgi:hypothetical protein